MKKNQTIKILVIIFIIILIGVGIYFLTRNKQKFTPTSFIPESYHHHSNSGENRYNHGRHHRQSKSRISELLEKVKTYRVIPPRRMAPNLLESSNMALRKKINNFYRSVNNKKADNIIKLVRSRAPYRGMLSVGDNDPAVLKKRLQDSGIGRSFVISGLNLENPASLIGAPRYSIFKEYSYCGKEVDNGDGMKVPTYVETISFDNKNIINTDLGASLTGNFSFSDSTEDIVHNMSSNIEGSGGAASSAVAISTSFSVNVTSETHTHKTFKGYNVTVQKNASTIVLDTLLFKSTDTFLDEFLLQAESIGDSTGISAIVQAPDDPKQTENKPVINGEPAGTNMHVKSESWNGANNFFQSWGTHILVSSTFGKKLNIWNTIETSSTDTTNTLKVKACLQIAAAGYQKCKTSGPGAPTTAPPTTAPPTTGIPVTTTTGRPITTTTGRPITTTTGRPITTTTGRPITTHGPTTPRGPVTTPEVTWESYYENYGAGEDSTQCPEKKVCIGYEAPSASNNNLEVWGQCVDNKDPKWSGGMEVCTGVDTSDKTKLDNLNTRDSVYIVGGDDKDNANIMSATLGGKPSISPEALTTFLLGSADLDKQMGYTFLPIWNVVNMLSSLNGGCVPGKVYNNTYNVRLAGGKCKGIIDDQDAINQYASVYKDFIDPNLKVTIEFPLTAAVLADVGDPAPGAWKKGTGFGSCGTSDTSVFASGTAVAVRCDIGTPTKIYPGNIKAYDYTYVRPATDTSPAINVIFIWVPTYATSKACDPCKLMQASLNLEAAYTQATVCPNKLYGNYKYYQKMVQLPIENSDILKSYACWNKASGCASDAQCPGEQRDKFGCKQLVGMSVCSGSDIINDTTLCSQTGGLWLDPIVDPSINIAGSSTTNYRTTTYNKDIANSNQYSCAGPNARLGPHKETINTSYDTNYDKNKVYYPDGIVWDHTEGCKCMNPYTMPASSITGEYQGLIGHNTGVYEDRFVWNQAGQIS